MNKTAIICIIFLLLAIIFLTKCNKEEICDKCLFSYPDSGFYGLNILNIQDTIFKSDKGPTYCDGMYNSMKAYLPTHQSKLRVTIEGKRVCVRNNQGWSTNYSIYKYDNYIFQAEGQIIADLQIYFCDEGKATIKIYENNFDTYSRIKVIQLQ